MPASWLLALILLSATPVLAQEEEDLNVLWKWARWSNPGSFLIAHYIEQADRYYDLRDREIAKLKTQSEWLKRQDWVKAALLTTLGPFPREKPTEPEGPRRSSERWVQD